MESGGDARPRHRRSQFRFIRFSPWLLFSGEITANTANPMTGSLPLIPLMFNCGRRPRHVSSINPQITASGVEVVLPTTVLLLHSHRLESLFSLFRSEEHT